MLYFILVVLFAIPVYLFLPTKIVGKKNIPKKGGVILCGNHQSNHDVILVMMHFRKCKNLAKIELKNKFIVGPVLKALGTIFVNRQKPGIEVFKKVNKHLQKGGALNLYPEGTRNITSDESFSAKSGAVMFAMKNDVPIVPYAIIRKPRWFRKNTIVVGQAFKFEQEKITKEVLDKNIKVLSKKILELRDDYLKTHKKLARIVETENEKLEKKRSKK